uniref:TraB family protein n=1 Tax=Tetraselmis sp. GSL018 TaxID=582737 RepID=A0A061QT92_9CHLO|mmetsp:Transcript_30201/g.71897  ORF Transcript_30201/g.71897 Transcript_30201/m.71897 type:complete len:281 (-) Transcript_30201:202-1044(-)
MLKATTFISPFTGQLSSLRVLATLIPFRSTNTQVACNTSSYLRNLSNGGEIFIVGTSHVSECSADEVRDVIRRVKPDVVFLELCRERASILRRDSAAEHRSFLEDVVSALSGGGGLASKILSLTGKTYGRMFRAFGLDMGKEFRVAIAEADRIGARLVYGDRSQQETISRVCQSIDMGAISQMMSSKLSPEEQRATMEAASLKDAVEGMKNRAVVREMVRRVEKAAPGLAQALIHERDEIMARALAKETGRVVAVVGLGHLDGIERRWEELVSPARIGHA